MKKKLLTALVMFGLSLTMTLSGCGASSKNAPEKAAESAKEIAQHDPAKNPLALFETSKGNFKVELNADKAPQTVKNFTDLSKKGFYDGLVFHRVIDGFMIQGGDPKGNGTGGPGYKIPDEFNKALRHNTAGILSMANAGPNTGGSQFFITLAATPWLDDKHAVFGKVVEGLDVVQAIGKVKTGAQDRPVDAVVIKKITIQEKP